jgi:hypothetical protein
MKLRKEFDSIGSVNVPNDKYWGASTQRSNKFFNIGKILVNISIIKSILSLLILSLLNEGLFFTSWPNVFMKIPTLLKFDILLL